MSLIKDSLECCKSELDLFAANPTNASILSDNYSKLSSGTLKGDETQINFSVPATEFYTDMSSIFLKLEVDLVKSDGKAIAATDKIGVINNFGHSLFDKVKVLLGPTGIQKDVEIEGNYAYKAYFLNILNHDTNAHETWLRNSLFIKDEPSSFDLIDIDKANKHNNGYLKRRQAFLDAKGTVDLKFQLHCDIFHSSKYLIGGIPLRIELIKNSNNFILMGDTGFKIIISKAVLSVRHCEISTAVKLAHISALQISNIKYPIKQNNIQVQTLLPGALSYEFIISNKVLPNKIVFGFVEDSAYNGTLTKNPFNFQNFDMTDFFLKVNSKTVHLQVDYTNDKFVEAYNELCDGLDFTTNITREDFKNGTALYMFNLNPDKGCYGQNNILKTGSIQIDIRFQKTFKEALKLIIFTENTNQIEIDKDYNIKLDY